MKKTCIGPQCVRPAKVKNLCNAHDLQMRRKGKLKPLRIPKTGCDHPPCDRKHHAGGYCGTHYRQFVDYGKTFDIGELYHQAKGGHETIEQFFWARVRKTDSCWEWTGSILRGRLHYGWITRYGYEQVAHRLSYQLHFGEIPDGMEVDHRCHNTICVNPKHLRLATASQNSMNRKGARSDSKSGVRGVRKYYNRYQVYVAVSEEKKYFGSYATLEEAEQVAIDTRSKYFGEFSGGS